MGEFHVDHVVDMREYADRVVAGLQPACKWVRAACQRHLDDLRRAEAAEYPFEFRPELAARIVTFIELLRHVKGKWGGERLARSRAKASTGTPQLSEIVCASAISESSFG
jgi:phage terminase large subunit-like protein